MYYAHALLIDHNTGTKAIIKILIYTSLNTGKVDIKEAELVCDAPWNLVHADMHACVFVYLLCSHSSVRSRLAQETK